MFGKQLSILRRTATYRRCRRAHHAYHHTDVWCCCRASREPCRKRRSSLVFGPLHVPSPPHTTLLFRLARVGRDVGRCGIAQPVFVNREPTPPRFGREPVAQCGRRGACDGRRRGGLVLRCCDGRGGRAARALDAAVRPPPLLRARARAPLSSPPQGRGGRRGSELGCFGLLAPRERRRPASAPAALDAATPVGGAAAETGAASGGAVDGPAAKAALRLWCDCLKRVAPIRTHG